MDWDQIFAANADEQYQRAVERTIRTAQRTEQWLSELPERPDAFKSPSQRSASVASSSQAAHRLTTRDWNKVFTTDAGDPMEMYAFADYLAAEQESASDQWQTLMQQAQHPQQRRGQNISGSLPAHRLTTIDWDRFYSFDGDVGQDPHPPGEM